MRAVAAAAPTPRRTRWLIAALVAAFAMAAGLAQSQPAASAAAASGTASAAQSVVPAPGTDLHDRSVIVNHRAVATFHASLLGRTPRERALAGSVAVKAVMQRGGPGAVTVWQGENTAGLQVDGLMVFYLVPGDVEPGSTLAETAEAARDRLQFAVDELRETSNLRRTAVGIGLSLVATAAAIVLLRVLFALRRTLLERVHGAFERWRPRHTRKSLLASYGQYASSALHGLAILVTWGLVLVLINIWATFVLRQFPFTRYWGERATDWMIGVIGQFALSAAEAVPGLLMAIAVFLLARLGTRANSVLMQRIERGEVEVSWLDADTAGPTRRIGNLILWLFAVALAYPFLPGANSDAFKGVSVLAGLMLSLGASSVVGQVMSGFALVYSRSLRIGEYVRAGDIEGTVTMVGLFAIKLHTGTGEEVSVPNSVVLGGPVRNYSRLAEGRYMLHVAVTIGYSTPWRQVHAMLLEAARRTPGVAADPVPYVMQTALSDFYVEYRLCAHGEAHAPARRAEALSQLYANVQDVFNENGVQIMSPHYMADPAQPQVVAPAHWSPALAPATSPPKGDAA